MTEIHQQNNYAVSTFSFEFAVTENLSFCCELAIKMSITDPSILILIRLSVHCVFGPMTLELRSVNTCCMTGFSIEVLLKVLENTKRHSTTQHHQTHNYCYAYTCQDPSPHFSLFLLQTCPLVVFNRLSTHTYLVAFPVSFSIADSLCSSKTFISASAS